MWKFIRPSGGRSGGGAHLGEQRLRAVRAALDLKPTSKIGFPYKPSALAYDPVSQLLAVGTGGGEVYVFGAPGVEFVINHQPPDQGHASFLSTSKGIRKIIFLNAETKSFGPAAGEAGGEFDRNNSARASSRHVASVGLKPRLITLCEDDTLHLWLLETTKDGRPRAKRLQTASLSRDRVTAPNDARNEFTSMCTTLIADEVHGLLLVGTERGQLLELTLQDFGYIRTIDSKDIARACPDLPRGSLGAVESIVQHPKYANLCLVGYSRGLVVVYNVKSHQVVCFGLVRATELEDACWCTLTGVPVLLSPAAYANGAGDAVDTDSAGAVAAAEAHAFITSHNDGSYQLWDLAANNVDLAQSEPTSAAVMLRDGPKNTPFGPFPCKAINRVAWLGHHFQPPRGAAYASSQYSNHRQQQQRIESLMMFSGGMQNNGPYSDQHTVSVVRNKGSGREEHVCFDCTSRVVDFLPIALMRQPPAEKSTSARSASADKVRAGAGDAGRDNSRGAYYAGFSLNRRDSGGGVNAARSSTRSRPSNPPASVVPAPVLEMFVAILLEEELVIIDLNRDVKRWADLTNPYLVPIHSSAITCYQLYDNVSSRVWRVLDNAHRLHQQPTSEAVGRIASNKQQNCLPVDKNMPESLTPSSVEQAWPVRGGTCLNRTDRNSQRCLLITGHEDGNLRLWDVGGVVLRLLLCVKTACYYTESDDENVDAGFANSHLNHIQHGGREGAQLSDLNDDRDDSLTNMEEEIAEDWPVRKLGRFDPFSDDPRFCIKRVMMCVEKGVITAAGTAGQVLVFKLNADTGETAVVPGSVVGSSNTTSSISRLNVEPLVIDAHILSDAEEFVWKGHKPLTIRSRVTLPVPTSAVACCRLAAVVQLHPPAACSALAVEPRWGLLAVGTAHGMALIDYVRRAPILIHCTLSSLGTDLATGSDTVMSRRKSFKKSLRESFRRMRRGRSSLRASHAMAVSGQRGASGGGAPTSGGIRSSVKHAKMVNELEARPPMERQVESRVQVVRAEDDGGMSSVVRALKFVYANLMNSQILVPTLWLGTNNGTIGAFTILVPQANDGAGGAEQRVTSVLCREIQLRHHAPVVGIEIVDSHTGTPMNEILKYYNKRMDAPSLVLPSDIQRLQLVIVSEEQLKAFSLPQLKPYGKYKLTAYDGALIRRMQLCQVVLETQPRSSGSSADQSSSKTENKQQSRLRGGGGGGAQPPAADDVAAAAPTPEIVDEQWCVSLLTNLGDIRVLTVPSFQPIVQWQMIAREDLVAISGLQFTAATGRGMYQCAASQFQRFSLFAPSSHLMNSADSSFGLVRCVLNNNNAAHNSGSPSHTTTATAMAGVSKLTLNSTTAGGGGGNKPSISMYNHGGGDSGSSTPVEDLSMNIGGGGGSRTGANDAAHYSSSRSSQRTDAKMVLENGGGNSSVERVSNASSCETLTNAPAAQPPVSSTNIITNVKTAAKTSSNIDEHHGYVSGKLSAESGLGSSVSSGSSGERQLSLANRGGAAAGSTSTSTVTTQSTSSSSSRARKSHRETAIN